MQKISSALILFVLKNGPGLLLYIFMYRVGWLCCIVLLKLTFGNPYWWCQVIAVMVNARGIIVSNMYTYIYISMTHIVYWKTQHKKWNVNPQKRWTSAGFNLRSSIHNVSNYLLMIGVCCQEGHQIRTVFLSTASSKSCFQEAKIYWWYIWWYISIYTPSRNLG